MLEILPDNIPTPAALGLSVVALGLGLVWMRVAVRDKLETIRRLSASTATYYVRAETTYRGLRALTEPTQAVDISQLCAATATRRERLADWACRQVTHIRDLATPTQNPPDWAEGEMTVVFHRAAADQNQDNPHPMSLNANPFPRPLGVSGRTAPPLTPATALPSTPERAQPPRRRDPAKRLPARARAWSAGLLDLRVPPLTLPAFPRPFQMPQPRQALPHDPRRMAMLPPDPMRKYRRPAVAA
jgi:hypothetical protein